MKKKRLWALRWPIDSGAPHEFLEQNNAVPAVFFSREAARRWKRNQYLRTPRVVELLERKAKP